MNEAAAYEQVTCRCGRQDKGAVAAVQGVSVGACGLGAAAIACLPCGLGAAATAWVPAG